MNQLKIPLKILALLLALSVVSACDDQNSLTQEDALTIAVLISDQIYSSIPTVDYLTIKPNDSSVLVFESERMEGTNGHIIYSGTAVAFVRAPDPLVAPQYCCPTRSRHTKYTDNQMELYTYSPISESQYKLHREYPALTGVLTINGTVGETEWRTFVPEPFGVLKVAGQVTLINTSSVRDIGTYWVELEYFDDFSRACHATIRDADGHEWDVGSLIQICPGPFCQ